MKNKKKNKPEQPGFMSENKSKIYILLLIMIPFILYFRVIHFDFTSYDDTNIISQNYNIIKNLENIPIVFTTDIFLTSTNSFYRPLQTLSFMIDAQLSGKNPWAYHLTNIILHILSVLVLFVFLKQINIKDDIAFLLSLLFSVHPMIATPVCWIPARADLFLTLLGLLSFVSFINYFNTQKTKYKVFHLLCFLPLCFAKETAIVFPILLIFYFYFIKKKSSFKEIIPFFIIWFFSFVIYFVLRENAIKVTDPSSVFGMVPFVKNLPTIPIIFGMIFIPQGLTTMPLFNLFSMIIGIIVFIIFITIIIKARIVKNAYLIFGALWFFCFTLPPMFFRLPLAEHEAEYFEHRTGLPLIGILIVMGILLNAILKKPAYKKILIVSPVVIILFAILSWFHSSDYTDALAFFSSAIKSNSHNAVALNTRAAVFFANGKIDEAAEDLDNAIRVYPIYSSPYFNKGNLYKRMNNQNQAEYYYSQAVKYDTLYPGINPNRADVYLSLSVLKVNLNKNEEALLLLKKAITIDSSDSKIYNILGAIYFNDNKYESAIHAYSKAIELEPNSSSLYITRGRAKYSIKDYIGALNDLNKGVELSPDYPEAYFYRGITKSEMGDNEGAISDLSTAIKLYPNFGAAYYYRGKAYSKLHKPVEAKENIDKASSLGYIEDSEQLKR